MMIDNDCVREVRLLKWARVSRLVDVEIPLLAFPDDPHDATDYATYHAEEIVIANHLWREEWQGQLL